MPGDEITCAVPGPRLAEPLRNPEATTRSDAATDVPPFAES